MGIELYSRSKIPASRYHLLGFKYLVVFLIFFLTAGFTWNSNALLAQTVVSIIDLSPESENGFEPSGLGINTETNRIYITDSASANVIVINGSNNQIINTIKVGDIPIGVGVNAVTNRIYVANSGSNNISVIDGSTNEVINTIDSIDVEGQLSAIAVNPETNLIYAANKNRFEARKEGNIIAIDGSTNEIIKIINVRPGLVAIDVNPETNRIYALSTLSSPPPDPTVPPDPGFENRVAVIDGFTNQIIATIEVGLTREPSSDIAVNSMTNRIYVANPFVVCNLNIIDGLTNKVIDGIGGICSDRICVNCTTNHIYVTTRSQQIDTNPVIVIDGSTNQIITSIKLTDNIHILFVPIGVNPDTNLVYVASNRGEVTVIQDDAEGSTSPTPSPTPTPATKLTTLTVEPTTAKKSRKAQTAVVTAKDQFGNGMAGVRITAMAKGKKAGVMPTAAQTDTDGTVEFGFRFAGKGGKIAFTADGLTATITQR